MGLADEIRSKKRGVDAAADRSALRLASYGSMKTAIDQLAPEFRQACKELGVRDEGSSRLSPKKTWYFPVPYSLFAVGLTSFGSWDFVKSSATGFVVKDSTAAQQWTHEEIVTVGFLRRIWKSELERKAIPNRG